MKKSILILALCFVLMFAVAAVSAQDVEEPVAEESVVEEPVAEVVEEAVVEEPAQAASAKKTNTTAKKTNNNTGMTAAKANEAPSVKEHAESAANKVANKAIDKAEQETTNAIVNSGKKKR